MELYPEQESGKYLQMRHYTTWRLLKSYWQSSEKFSAYLFLIAIITMTIIIVGFDVVFTYWSNSFYTALQAYDLHLTVRLFMIFCVLAAFHIVLQVYRYFISQLFGLRWRRWLTDQLMTLWLKNRGYYYLESFDKRTDNPDQRIQEDAGTIVSNSIDLTVGLVSALTTFPAFIFILWTLSGILTISLGPFGVWHIPGYLVWVSILYNLIGTFITFKIGRPLVPLNFEQQRREASFRFAAIDVRSHSEHIALYRGEEHQETILQRFFGRVLNNLYAIILRQKLLLWFTGSFNQIAVIVPLVVALPNYFGKVFLLGGLMQSIRAFSSVQDSLSYLINSYTQIAQWRAIARRLTTFLNHLHEIENKAAKEDHLSFSNHVEDSIITNDVTIRTPENNLLLQAIDTQFTHGKNYLIKGESGIGKSTFVRTLAGIWPFAAGEIIFPQNKQVMFLPQKPYMPIGTLADALFFPEKRQKNLETQLPEILEACHLAQFIPRLNEVATWSEQMSPGEQQRIAFARVLLQKPDWVFLDESTSMLDLANEEYLYKLLQKRLPHCSIVSVGHRPSLQALHDVVIDVEQFKVAQPAVQLSTN